MAETTPVEEMPLGMLIAWLSVFLAVVLYTITFAGPFVLVRRLRSRARAHRPARHAR